MDEFADIIVSYFRGSNYWEVCIDGDQVYTTENERDAFLFRAQLILFQKAILGGHANGFRNKLMQRKIG